MNTTHMKFHAYNHKAVRDKALMQANCGQKVGRVEGGENKE